MAKRKCYDVLEAIDCADKTSKQAAARKFGVDAKRLRVWCSQREELMMASNNTFFLKVSSLDPSIAHVNTPSVRAVFIIKGLPRLLASLN